MRRPTPTHWLILLVSLAVLIAPPARAVRGMKHAPLTPNVAKPAAARVPVTCDPLPGAAPDQLPVVRSAVGLNFVGRMLEHPGDGTVEICVLVDSTGTVREAGISKSQDPFDASALESARWWLFAPARRGDRAVPARIAVNVEAHVPRDADPLVPDVIALAEDAEARGDLRGALDAWTGALARAGAHPALQNEWAIRAQVIRLAARFTTPPEIPLSTTGRARSQRALMLRNISRADNQTYAAVLDGVLRDAPWYADAYRWRASARAACGQRDGAVRDVLCYRLAVRDSAERALADRALVMLAAADTVGALTLLKN